MIGPVVAVPQLDPEQAARVRAAWEQLRRQIAEAVEALRELFRQFGAALRRALAPLVRLTDQRRVRLRVMHLAYRRRLRNRRRGR
ncbi:hypothetical protein HCA58_05265 [Micromonospora sp. HNM0581]|uniref:hypothetical protein n=1 Tax=Micromonospora sp. HNM0581 TaxID=2716341 RepID=UPI00146DFA96|nr:hypothetical protein [Micromonospora sp. HNM0581]NLU77815.1 hypothetical protein [Micromonospora sp. HNM0581]